ncbi:MAG: hypothetical protein P9L92_18275 [Candidatus Electryonea clarkiae]|nr:hypothetical protein [Candidatus Electryonea clarkiae]MDP8288478.1 hypothetical protein [Candidatus Electryonea clarkiae]
MLTTTQGIVLLLGYGLAMVIIVFLARHLGRSERTVDDFLVMGRRLSTIPGSLSIAVSWIWAPAVFICSLQSYTQGLPGIFWFTIPNIICFFTFAPLAIRARKIFPSGYTLPDFQFARFNGDPKVHIASLLVYFGYQLGAIIINCLAGGTLLHMLTGMPFFVSVLLMTLTALTYSLISGLRASVLTDVLQMSMILLVAFVLVPWVLFKAGGPSVLIDGLGGVSGDYRNILNPYVAYSFGIATTIGLISGPIADQMFFQRAFAVKKKSIVKVFIFGGLIFGVVPIILSLLGFIGAAPSVNQQINVTDPQMIGPIVIAHFLPTWALMAFSLMAFAGLTSTLDSALCALSSLGSVDVYKKYVNKAPKPANILKSARLAMVFFAIIGTGIALLRPQLLWVFLIYGALASATLFPTVFSLFSTRVPSWAIFWSLVLSLLIGTPLSIYANVTGNIDLVVLAAILSVAIGFIVCTVGTLMSKERFDFSSINDHA